MESTYKIGETNVSNEGYVMKIVEYNGVRNIIIEFQDEYRTKVHTNYQAFKKGQVKNPYYPSVCGIGYLGQGKYKVSVNKKQTKAYEYWRHMLTRCYDPYYLDKHPTYRDCIVCDEWLCFQNFAEWFYKHYYEIPNERMELDKDILIKGNKIYSSKTCCFVPQRINILYTKRQNYRGEYPIGVYYHKIKSVLEVWCNTLEKKKYLGSFSLDRPFQAFTCYKNYKEDYVKKVADIYKDTIPKELYKALYKYEVEIND